MNKVTDLLNERINWLEDEIKELEGSAAKAITLQEKTGWSIACGLLHYRERKLTALHELKAVLSEATKP
jgi:hypothetical protein